MILIYIALVFGGSNAEYFDYVIADNLYEIIIFFMLGLILCSFEKDKIINNKNNIIIFGIGIFAGLLSQTRPEEIYAYFIIIGYQLLYFYYSYKINKDINIKKYILKNSIILCTPILFFWLSISAANYLNFNYFATYDLKMDNFIRLNKVLMSISSEDRTLKIPIPMDVRQIAYKNSESFGKLEPYLEGGLLKDYEQLAYEQTGVHGNHGVWWIWALKRAVERVGNVKSGADYDRFYGQCADELSLAISKNLIQEKYNFSPFFYVDIKKLPSAIFTEIKGYFVLLSSPKISFGIPHVTSDPNVNKYYNAIALRRVSLLTDSSPQNNLVKPFEFIEKLLIIFSLFATGMYLFLLPLGKIISKKFAFIKIDYLILIFAIVFIGRIILISLVAAVGFTAAIRYVLFLQPLLLAFSIIYIYYIMCRYRSFLS